MDLIRKRPGAEFTPAQPYTPVQAGGFVSADQNPILQDGNADVRALQQAPIGMLGTAAGALQETIAAKFVRGVEYMSMPSEDGFDVRQAMQGKASGYTEDELSFLGDARSNAELSMRQQQVLATRENYAAMAANPVTAIAASLMDVDAVIGFGVGKLAGVTRTVRAMSALSANAAVLGVASQGGEIGKMDIIGTSLGVLLAAVPSVKRAATAVDRTAEAGADAAQGTERALAGAAPEDGPGGAPVRAAGAVDEGAEAAPAATRNMPDPDYVQPRPDLLWDKPHVNVAIGEGAAIRTSTQNALRAVLNLGDDLDEGTKVLGRALSESLDLDADVPMVLRTRTAESRSNAKIGPDGSVTETNLYSRAGAQVDLDSTIKGMTAQEKSIVLHEAAHAKTAGVLRAWQDGRLTEGPAFDAVTRIDEIRQEVAANTKFQQLLGKRESGLNYGLNSNDEFISQLFNDAKFRTALQGVKVGKQSVWSELVQKVVQAFTGKAPGDTALSATVQEFEKLLGQSNNVAKLGARDMPTVQSESLLAPKAQNLKELVHAAHTKIQPNMSLYDNLAAQGPRMQSLAERLVVDATSSEANSATHYARSAELAANVAAAQVDMAFQQAMTNLGWQRGLQGAFSRVRNPRMYLDHRKELESKVYAQLAENHRRFRAGDAIEPHGDPDVQKVVDAFANSRWAEGNLERIKASGMTGSEMIESSPYYLPRQHSADKVREYLARNPGVRKEDIEDMYAGQFLRMFSSSGMDADRASQLGKQMLRNMQDRASGQVGYRQAVAGMTEDDIEASMRSIGIDEAQIEAFMGTAKRAGDEPNTARNLKRRVSFDMTAEHTTANGTIIHPQMFVNTNVTHLMERYSRNMSGRIGMAKAGFPDLRDVLREVDEAAGTAPDPRAARELLDETVNRVLGYPTQTGRDVPDILRSASTLSGTVALAGSGVLQIADTSLLAKEFGLFKTIKALGSTSWGRDALAMAQHPEYGSRLRDVLEAKHVLSGRYRSALTHLDDNTDIGSMQIAHQNIQQLGQGTRFMNGMEYVRRGQVKLMAGLVGDSIDDAIKGNPKAIQQLRKFGLHDELLAKARAATAENPDLRAWPHDIRFDMENVASNMADQLVLENRLGELPAFMEFSPIGKVIFPYLSFVAGAWNKLLLRTYHQEGAAGVAMMFAYQAPLAALATTANMALQGKDLNAKDIVIQTLSNIPLMSWFGYALNFMTQGPSNSIASLGIVDKAHTAISGIISGDASAEQIVKAIPFLSIVPGMRMIGGAMDEMAHEGR